MNGKVDDWWKRELHPGGNPVAVVADVNRRRLAPSLNRTPETRRASLSDEERLKLALAEIDRLRAELRLEQALGEIERAADDLRKLSC